MAERVRKVQYFYVITPDTPGDACGGNGKGGGGIDFSYIWIADSSQNAVSKINTQTLIEEGRYLVHPGYGNPSRTSVSLSGDVAIANRAGGVTKVYAELDDCQDVNGMPGIQTSSGGADVLAWGTDDCVAWHTPMNYSTQRPIRGDVGRRDCPHLADSKPVFFVERGQLTFNVTHFQPKIL